MNTSQSTSLIKWSRSALANASTIHLILAGLYGLYVMLSYAWNLVTLEVVLERSLLCILLLVVSITGVMVSRKKYGATVYRRFLWLIILSDIFIACSSIYSQRGMASRAVMLYALPIIVASNFLRLRELITVTLLSALSYMASAGWYFHTHFNEGYKAELFIEVGFYSSAMFIFAALLWSLLHLNRSTKQ